MKPRQVTYAEFVELECNRCGDCCEDFTLDWPLSLIRAFGMLEEAPDYWSDERRIGHDRRRSWMSDLEPIGVHPVFPERLRYRCHRMQRLDDGTARCGDYDNRPSPCVAFPGGPRKKRPPVVVGYERCTWNVEVVDAGPERRLGRMAGTYGNGPKPPPDLVPAIADIARRGWAEAERIAA